MLLVAPPGAERARVERLAHLLGARGPHRPLRLVEAQAGLLERQAAVVEDAAHLRLEVPDRLLVVHVQHLARQDAVPVLHGLVVLAVIERELVHVVGEVLALAEQLLVAAEAAVERMAPRIDDPRIRQDQVGEADVREVVRQLVGEARLVGRAVDAGLLDVLLARRRESPGRAARARLPGTRACRAR